MIHYPELKIGDQVLVPVGEVVRVAGTQMGRRTLQEPLVGRVFDTRTGTVWLTAEDDRGKRVVWTCFRRQVRRLTDIEALAYAGKVARQKTGAVSGQACC